MKNKILSAAMAAFLMVFFSGCEMIGNIFSAGIWTGIILVVLVIGLIIFLVTRGKK